MRHGSRRRNDAERITSGQFRTCHITIELSGGEAVRLSDVLDGNATNLEKRMKRLFGWLVLGAVFALLFAACAVKYGVLGAALLWVVSIVITAIIVTAVWMITAV